MKGVNMKWIGLDTENEAITEEETDANQGTNPGTVACCRGFCCGDGAMQI